MKRGFTLLEVVVAMAILALSLMAISRLNSGAMANHVYTKRLTVATLLARSKMIDLEQKLHDKGVSLDDEEDSGDFSDEGWPSYKWRAKILAPRTQGLSPEKLIAAVFNLPMPGAGGSDSTGGLAALFGGNGAKSAAKAPSGGGPDTSGGMFGALGPMGALVQGQFTQMIDQITKSVREVHLTVLWKDGTAVESFDLVTHIVSLGPGSDRNSWNATGAGLSSSTSPGAGGMWVRQVDGRAVANPIPGPNGQMVDPADNTPVIPMANVLSQNPNVPRQQIPMPFNMPNVLPGGLR